MTVRPENIFPEQFGWQDLEALHRVIQTSPYVLVRIKESGTIVAANPAASALTGIEASKLIGRNWWNLLFPGALSEQVDKFFEALNQQGLSLNEYWMTIATKSTMFWNQVQISPIRNENGQVTHFIGIQNDITERKRALDVERFLNSISQTMAQSLHQEETLKMIASMSIPLLGDNCAVFLYDEEKRSLTRIFVASKRKGNEGAVEELLQTDTSSLHPDADIGVLHVAISKKPEFYPHAPHDRFLEAGVNPKRLELWKTVGLESYMAVPLVARGRTIGVLAFSFGKDGRRHVREDLDLALELSRRASVHIDNARLYEELQRELRIREDFTSILSHDLKNPLASILMAASMIEQYEDPSKLGVENLKRMIESIHNAGRRMKNMINVLLDVTKIATDSLPVHRVPLDARSLVEATHWMFHLLAERRGIQLDSSAVDPDAAFLGDRERLLQALSNLVGNALKFTPKGGKVTLGAKGSGNEAA